MIFSVVDNIKNNKKSDYENLVKDSFTKACSWVDNNGKQSFLIGALVGVLLILFFKPIVIVLFILALVVGALWLLAASPDDAPSEVKPKKQEKASEATKEEPKSE